jgi:thioredoxin reductase (NADPH)
LHHAHITSFCSISLKEFDRLLQKHGTETGLPVVVDFYSDSCGPCRMMAPIFKKVAAEFAGKAVFVKVDTNAQHELSGRYNIRSLPTFQWFVGGKRSNEAKGGIGEGPLRQMTEQAISEATMENVQLELEALVEFYATVDPTKAREDIEAVYQKCVGKKKATCQGSTANTLVRKLKKKYKQAPLTSKLWTGEESETSSSSGKDEGSESPSSSSSSKPSNNNRQKQSSGNSKSPNLHLATMEDLQAEVEKRLDELREAQLEDETDEEEEAMDDHSHWPGKGDFPERVTIIGGGPAGMAAAIYAARAGLTPLVLAPSMGGQLQGKGVEVENYPGMNNVTGPAVISAMRQQAAHFGAVFEEDFVIGIDASSRPLKILTNGTGAIETHSIIVATGADSKWLGIKGEYELRGGGVSSCATCDGFLFGGKHVVVVGGGDAAMEDALVLARTSKKVTVVHRRDEFRASKILADRVKVHPAIEIQWNTEVESIEGKVLESSSSNSDEQQDEEVDLDNAPKVVSAIVLKDAITGEIRKVACDAVFIAIGHSPNTNFLQGVVEFDPEHTGYVQTVGRSTKTSVAGIFASGDVSDAVYRQAITSAGSGAAAALDVERWLSEEGLGNEAAELEAELLAEFFADDSMTDKKDSGYNAYEDAGGRMHGMRESVGVEL